MTKTVVFKVGMTCGGCSGAVSRILSKIAGKLRLFVFGLSLR
jgi:copper chaperone CopZ